jgi:tetratricopeptide (TPR) repeat protein/transcriptional regulator with XRE-family HTH domain
MSENGREFGVHLRVCRTSAGLTQQELAERSGLSARAISNLERGRARQPYRTTVQRLADALGLRDTARTEFISTAGRRLASVADASAGAAGGLRPAVTGPPVPRQLPARVRAFTGRESELAALTALLPPGRGPAPAAMVICAISGTAGVGKTALAVWWAHQVAGKFPDGQLYLDLRGYDIGRPLPAAEALAAFLQALGMPGPQIPAGAGERAAAYRSLMAGRRMLVVLDNARNAEQVRPLLPGASTCAVMVTSRDALAGLVVRDGARRLDLDLLPSSDANRLLRALIGPRAQAEPEAVARVAALCCGLPLALRLAAELAAAHPGARLATLAAELADSGRRLDLLSARGDERTAMRAVLSWSYRHLDAAQARMFCLLGLNPGHDFGIRAAAALAGVAPDAAARQASQLASTYLIQPADPGRYRMHDLLRSYAREHAAARYGEAARRAALTRLFDDYLHSAAIARQALFPGRTPRQDSGLPDTPAPQVSDPATARAWLGDEAGNLSAIIDYMAVHGWPSRAIQLAISVFPCLAVSGRIAEAVAIVRRALRAAQSTGEREAEGALLGHLGGLHLQQGRYQLAAGQLRRARTACRKTRDLVGEAAAVGDLAVVYRRQGSYRQAADLQRQALTIYRQAGDTAGEALTLARLGSIEWRQGRLAQAAGHLRQALHLAGEIGDQIGQAEALTRLGVVECHQGHHQQAAGHHRQALTLFRQSDDQVGEAEALNGLGEVMLAMGSPRQARACHADALSLSQRTGDQDQQASARHGLARACLALGQADLGRDHLRETLAIYTTLGAAEAGNVRAELEACLRQLAE